MEKKEKQRQFISLRGISQLKQKTCIDHESQRLQPVCFCVFETMPRKRKKSTTDLNTWTVVELRKACQKYSDLKCGKLKKAELIAVLSRPDTRETKIQQVTSEEELKALTVKQLQQICRQHKICQGKRLKHEYVAAVRDFFHQHRQAESMEKKSEEKKAEIPEIPALPAPAIPPVPPRPKFYAYSENQKKTMEEILALAAEPERPIRIHSEQRKGERIRVIRSIEKPRKPSPRPRVIGQGSFGCVYRPGLKCKQGVGNGDELNRKYGDDTKYVMKVTNDAEVKHDQHIAQRLLRVKDHENYFTTVLAPPCVLEKLPEDCEATEGRASDDIKGFYMRYRGPALSKGWLPDQTLKTTLEVCVHLFEGLSLMHDANVTHNDIKPLNVLMAPPKSKTKESPATFIDFGFGTAWMRGEDAKDAFELINTVWNRYVFTNGKGQYVFWPADFNLLDLDVFLYEDTKEINTTMSWNTAKAVVGIYYGEYQSWNPLFYHGDRHTAIQHAINRLQLSISPVLKPMLANLLGYESPTKIKKEFEEKRFDHYNQIVAYFKTIDIYMMGALVWFFWGSLSEAEFESPLAKEITQYVHRLCHLEWWKRPMARQAHHTFQEFLKRA